MRRWEFVGDGSAKFWEAEVEGASVTVRYGRIGTEGRLQAKELASPAAARAQFATLVAEKERKGYAEVGAAAAVVAPPAGPAAGSAAEPVAEPVAAPVGEPAAEPVAAPVGEPVAGPVAAPVEEPVAEPARLPDEDTFVLPTAWRRLVHPRRDRTVRNVTPPGPEAAEPADERIAAGRGEREQALANAYSDPALVRAVGAFLAGEADPTGAAAVAAMLVPDHHYDTGEALLFADAWIARYGLTFAALAVVDLFDVECGWHPGRPSQGKPALRFRGQSDFLPPHKLRPAADRVRALLAAADQQVYDETVAALAGCRTTPRRRLVTAYLAPGTPGWADACVTDSPGYGSSALLLRTMLLCALDDPGQVARLGPSPQILWHGWSVGLVATLADSLGTACVPFLDQAIERAGDSAQRRTIASAVAQFPTDDAFALLLSRLDDKHMRSAVQEAMQRYPVRAVRLLATAAAKGGKNASAARQLLNGHVTLHQALLPEMLPLLDRAARELVGTLDGARERVAEADAQELPELLVSPPWTRKRTPRKARVLEGLQPDDAPQVVWRPGEQESWSRSEYAGWQYPEFTDWAAEAAKVLGERGNLWSSCRLLVQGPAEVLAPFVETWRPTDLWGGQEYLRPIVGRYGMAALPMALSAAQAQPANLAGLLLPFLDAGAARVMADGLARLKSVQPTARSWFSRHGVPAALLLVPDAVGPAGPARRAAEQALRLVAAAEGADAVRAAVSARYGDEAAEIVAEALATDPLENALPARMPALPAWVQPAVLPQIVLASGKALPEDSVRHVLTMLALSKPADPYPGLAVVVDACRGDSLAAFAWALFEEWRQAGMPAKESWILHALGPLGDDETVRRLTPILRDWPGQGAHHRAVEGLTVLAGIGSDVALLHLHGVAQRVKFKALKVRAQEKIAEVAQGLGLTGEQLSDRLVPDLGLDADGTTVVDYGPRRFTVGFDEQLRPFVRDADGKRRKDLPVPGVKDDQELAPAERKRFAALKKDVRTIAADQIRRLEAAMVAQRGWTAAEFRELFVAHPLVWHLVRRLVWLAETPDPVTAGQGADTPGASETPDATGAAEDGGRTTTTAFRVAEDRSLADVEDDEFHLADDATVRLAHPLHLGDAVDVWSELFADYEILQPFPQLGRTVRRLTPEEAAGNRLHRFEGRKVPVGRLLGLTKKGWDRGEPQDAGVERWISKRLGDGCHLVIALDEGIAVGMVDVFPDQTLETVWLDSAPGDHWPGRRYDQHLGDLDPVAASELLNDLEEVTAA